MQHPITRIVGFTLGKWRLWRWFVLTLLSAFIAVQLSPYLALAAIRAAIPTGIAPAPSLGTQLQLSDAELLAQLDQLPSGTVALPNFDPAVNGFQFSNQELVEAIDLDRNAQNWQVVLTEQMKQLFGTQVCVGEFSSGCVLTAAAQSWLSTQLSRLDQGISEGMAAAVLDLWQPVPTPIPWWQRLINTLLGRAVFGLARTLFEVQTFISNLFLMQGVNEVFQPTQTIRTTLTPTQILLAIARVFVTGSGNPFTMGIYRLAEGALTEGHALTPYRVENRGDGKYWVYVYDSNYPAGRPSSPTDLHVEFDTQADTWRYQPASAQGKALDSAGFTDGFAGNAESHNLDLTQRSWRQPQGDSPSENQPPAVTGPFTCPFCAVGDAPADANPESAPEPTVDITLVGEGQMTVTPYLTDAPTKPVPLRATDQATLVPFKGGLDREVPASYRLTAAVLGQPLRVELIGVPNAQGQSATLQLTGPGYTATLADLNLSPAQPLTLYLVANTTGPEITLVASQTTIIPKLSINLTDAVTTRRFNSSTPEMGFTLTDRQVSKSSGFNLTGLTLSGGKRVALAAKTDLKRLYFADDDQNPSQYALTVTNRMVIKDRIQLGERQPDFVNYTLTYDEEMRAVAVPVAAQNQAFFAYEPAFVDPGERPRQELLAALEQRTSPIAIAYEPLTTDLTTPGPLRLVPSGTNPIGQQVFQGSLRVRELN